MSDWDSMEDVSAAKGKHTKPKLVEAVAKPWLPNWVHAAETTTIPAQPREQDTTTTQPHVAPSELAPAGDDGDAKKSNDDDDNIARDAADNNTTGVVPSNDDHQNPSNLLDVSTPITANPSSPTEQQEQQPQQQQNPKRRGDQQQTTEPQGQATTTTTTPGAAMGRSPNTPTSSMTSQSYSRQNSSLGISHADDGMMSRTNTNNDDPSKNNQDEHPQALARLTEVTPGGRIRAAVTMIVDTDNSTTSGNGSDTTNSAAPTPNHPSLQQQTATTPLTDGSIHSRGTTTVPPTRIMSCASIPEELVLVVSSERGSPAGGARIVPHSKSTESVLVLNGDGEASPDNNSVNSKSDRPSATTPLEASVDAVLAAASPPLRETEADDTKNNNTNNHRSSLGNSPGGHSSGEIESGSGTSNNSKTNTGGGVSSSTGALLQPLVLGGPGSGRHSTRQQLDFGPDKKKDESVNSYAAAAAAAAAVAPPPLPDLKKDEGDDDVKRDDAKDNDDEEEEEEEESTVPPPQHSTSTMAFPQQSSGGPTMTPRDEPSERALANEEAEEESKADITKPQEDGDKQEKENADDDKEEQDKIDDVKNDAPAPLRPLATTTPSPSPDEETSAKKSSDKTPKPSNSLEGSYSGSSGRSTECKGSLTFDQMLSSSFHVRGGGSPTGLRSTPTTTHLKQQVRSPATSSSSPPSVNDDDRQFPSARVQEKKNSGEETSSGQQQQQQKEEQQEQQPDAAAATTVQRQQSDYNTDAAAVVSTTNTTPTVTTIMAPPTQNIATLRDWWLALICTAVVLGVLAAIPPLEWIRTAAHSNSFFVLFLVNQPLRFVIVATVSCLPLALKLADAERRYLRWSCINSLSSGWSKGLVDGTSDFRTWLLTGVSAVTPAAVMRLPAAVWYCACGILFVEVLTRLVAPFV